jgi:thiol-disulfide isomerase/thioredoxin
VILLGLVMLTIPLILLFIPESNTGTVQSLEGVTLSNTSGEKFKLSGIFSDKKTLLVFWSITCYTCIEEIPFIISLHEKLKEKVNIIGIHPAGYQLTKIQRFLKKFPHKIPYTLAIDDESKLTKTFEVTVLPKTVLINSKGEVLYSHIGYDESMESEIEREITSKL